MLRTDRIIRKQTYDPNTGAAQTDSEYQCPPHLANTSLCYAARTLALRTTGSTAPPRRTSVRSGCTTASPSCSSTSPDHSLSIGYIGSPTEYDDYSGLRSLDVQSQCYYRIDQIHDANARYIGKLFNRKLQIDAATVSTIRAAANGPTICGRRTCSGTRTRTIRSR